MSETAFIPPDSIEVLPEVVKIFPHEIGGEFFGFFRDHGDPTNRSFPGRDVEVVTVSAGDVVRTMHELGNTLTAIPVDRSVEELRESAVHTLTAVAPDDVSQHALDRFSRAKIGTHRIQEIRLKLREASRQAAQRYGAFRKRYPRFSDVPIASQHALHEVTIRVFDAEVLADAQSLKHAFSAVSDDPDARNALAVFAFSPSFFLYHQPGVGMPLPVRRFLDMVSQEKVPDLYKPDFSGMDTKDIQHILAISLLLSRDPNFLNTLRTGKIDMRGGEEIITAGLSMLMNHPDELFTVLQGKEFSILLDEQIASTVARVKENSSLLQM